MGKSRLDSRFIGDSLIKSIREEQLERLRRVDDLWKSQLADWEDLAKAEDAVRREYSGRYLFELLQNASDAIVDGVEREEIKPQEGMVRVQVTDRSLLIANTGMPFEESNVRALCRLHVTTKSASKQIGHKGIGFKSVLEITESPEVYSGIFAFGFDRHEFAQQVRKIVGSHDIPEESVPILRAPFTRRLGWLPAEEREIIEGMFDQGYVTVIRLPFKTRDTAVQVEEKVRAELIPELLLFLGAVFQLEVRYSSGEDVAFWREESQASHEEGCHEVLLWTQRGDESPQVESRWLVLSSGEIQIPNRNLVAGLGEAWEDVQAVRCMVAFPLSLDGKNLRTDLEAQRFYVYFPTEEPCGLRFLVNADFYIEAARKDIRRNRFNEWLANELVTLISDLGVKSLRARFPRDPAIVDILAPAQNPGRAFGDYFLEQYLAILSSTPFVPLQTGHYKPPEDIRLPPREVDSQQFRKFFPASRLRGKSKWAFPLPEVEKREHHRKQEGQPFLLRLGAAVLQIDEVVEALRNGPPVPSDQRGEFFRFLAHWWNALPYSEGKRLVDLLEKCPIVPTASGWKNPTEGLIFQANLRQKEDIQVPIGFDFEIVPLEIYGEERSFDGVPARFLQALGVGSYEVREIVRRAILPVLCTPERFEALRASHPLAVYEAYAFLKRYYYEEERSTADFRERFRQVPVPAYANSDPSERQWRPASEVYFSSYWTRNDDLEVIYGHLDDVYFLGPIEEIEGLKDPKCREEWYGFFAWLGVNYKPRVITAEGGWNWYKARAGHPFSGRRFWRRYIQAFETSFDCGNPRKNHGRSRRMGKNWALDHFEEIVERRDLHLSSRLFRLLGYYWQEYASYLETTMTCHFTTTGCDDKRIPSYLAYCLRELEWVPARWGGQLTPHLFRPSELWAPGEDVPPEVRQMLPSLPDEFRSDRYKAIRVDLFKTEVTLEDYLELLQRLPDLYPLEPPSLEGSDLKQWQSGVRALFNWIMAALQNGLVRLGEENWPQRPRPLKVLAYCGDKPRYVDVNEATLVYPDNPFLADRWAESLLYLRVDEDWASLREWLAVRRLSERVHCEVVRGEELADLSDQISAHFAQVLPYFLALVHEKQNSRFDRVLGRLQRLHIHVVESLVVRQHIPDLEIPPVESNEQVYLEPRDEPNPRGGRPVRAGDLYIVRDAIGNPDILGGLIAHYIEIAGLRDAFTILYERNTHEGRMRYLESQGISEGQLYEVKERLNIPRDVETSRLSVILERVSERKQVEVGEGSIPEEAPFPPPSKPVSHVSSTSSDREETQLEKEGDQEVPQTTEQREWPPLDISSPILVKTFQASSPPPSREEKGNLRYPGGGGGWSHRTMSEEERTVLGRRGEEWAYAAERQRLRELGLDPDALEQEGRLKWISKTDWGSPYDIRSVDLVDGELVEIYIEVKSTAGRDRSVGWSAGEFRLAMEHGDRYWIYWVANADRERPDPPVRYQNPIHLWKAGYIELNFRQFEITLPEEET